MFNYYLYWSEIKSETFFVTINILDVQKNWSGEPIMSDSIEARIKKALEEVRPQLQADGGDIEYLGFENGIVKVKLRGSCSGCPMSAMTLQWGVENYLKKQISEVNKVEAVQ